MARETGSPARAALSGMASDSADLVEPLREDGVHKKLNLTIHVENEEDYYGPCNEDDFTVVQCNRQEKFDLDNIKEEEEA